MKILHLEVDGFRSLKKLVWDPKDLNVVIGPNASGKSNLLRVLDLLSLSARGRLGDHIQREGGMESLVWDGEADSIRIRAKMSPLPPSTDVAADSLTYELRLARIGKTSAYRIDYEILGNFCRMDRGETTEPFKLLERDPRHAVIFSTDEKRFVAPEASVSEEESLLSAALGPFPVNPFIVEFQRELADWSIHQGFHTHREAAIRTPSITRADTHVNSDGQNLISVLHNLYETSREFKNDVDSAMRAAFGDEFEQLMFPAAADQRIQLRVRWKSLGQDQSAANLSDGTLRFLFLMAVLANPKPPPLIAIDEPETGLHPNMLPLVAEYAAEVARRSQVIITTHSPDLLNAFSENVPTTTVVDWRQGETALKVLSGQSLEYWLREYSLGDLYRSSELEVL